jgi:hypothetical protein
MIPALRINYIISTIALFVSVCISANVHAQVGGTLTEQTHITDLMDRWRIYNMGNKEVRGLRVQILATTDRRHMETVQREFERKYPDYPVHFAHNEPYWYLKTGAFLTNQKAQAFMKQLSKEYPSSLIVSDLIKGEEFLLYDQ